MSPVLVNVSVAGSRPFPALLHEGRVLALAWWKGTILEEIHDFGELMARWATVGPLLESISGTGTDQVAITLHGAPVEGMQVHAPVSPSQVFCTIGNYRSQVIEAAIDSVGGPNSAEAVSKRQAVTDLLDRRHREGSPYICIKPTSCVTGPNAFLPVSKDLPTLDWESEIGVVIGRKAWKVKVEDALGHVAGYCVVNDITLRERIFRPDPALFGTDWIQSKGGPGWLPTGPWLAPSWSVPDPRVLRPWLRLNEQLMQDGCADDMVFSVAEQIAYLSQHTLLQPGDLLCTGSPAGFGSHHGRFLMAGDVLEAGVQGLGAQRISLTAE